jgi:hypothetical protein
MPWIQRPIGSANCGIKLNLHMVSTITSLAICRTEPQHTPKETCICVLGDKICARFLTADCEKTLQPLTSVTTMSYKR